MQKNDYPKLRECPFCGGKAVQKVEYVGIIKASFVKCEVCGARLPGVLVSEDYCAKDIAKEKWNRRTDR